MNLIVIVPCFRFRSRWKLLDCRQNHAERLDVDIVSKQ